MGSFEAVGNLDKMFQPNMFDNHHHLLDMITKPPSEGEISNVRDEDFENKSGSEAMELPSGDDLDPNQRPKKKRYHRHTQHQIQELEA